MLKMVDIDHETGALGLEVNEDQKNFVASELVILARAYIFRKFRSRAFYLFDGEAAVGIALYYDCPERNAYDFCQLFIDKNHQKKGYGKEAIALILDELKKDGKYDKVVMCYVEGNDVSRKLFESFGFIETEKDYDEIIMEKTL